MKPEDIEQSIKKLRRPTTAETDERILNDAFAALEKSTSGAGRLDIRRIAKFAAGAAVIIAVVLIGIGIFTGPAEEPVREAVKKMDVSVPKEAVETPADEQATAKLERELELGVEMFAAGDVDGLVAMLTDGQLQSKLAAAYFLAEIGDERAIDALEKLSTEAGGHKDNPFAAAVKEIKTRVQQEKEPSQAVEAIAEEGEQFDAEEEKMIYGWLLDSSDNPVRGSVMLDYANLVEADANGEFAIAEPCQTPKDVHVGYAWDIDKKLGKAFLWKRTAEANDLEIILEPFATITGQVVDQNGTALADVELRLDVSAGEPNLITSSATLWQTTMDSEGQFWFEVVPVGLPMVIHISDLNSSTVAPVDRLQAGKIVDVGDIVLRLPPKPRAGQEEIDVNFLGRITDQNEQ